MPHNLRACPAVFKAQATARRPPDDQTRVHARAGIVCPPHRQVTTRNLIASRMIKATRSAVESDSTHGEYLSYCMGELRMQRECDACGARGDKAKKLLKCDGCKVQERAVLLTAQRRASERTGPSRSASAGGCNRRTRPGRQLLATAAAGAQEK